MYRGASLKTFLDWCRRAINFHEISDMNCSDSVHKINLINCIGSSALRKRPASRKLDKSPGESIVNLCKEFNGWDEKLRDVHHLDLLNLSPAAFIAKFTFRIQYQLSSWQTSVTYDDSNTVVMCSPNLVLTFWMFKVLSFNFIRPGTT